MTKNSFHENLVELISKNKPFIKQLVEFNPDRVITNRYFHNRHHEDYEIDIYTLSNNGESSIFEIKSHRGLIKTFTGKQLSRFKKYHPKSQIWLIYPNTPYNLDINDLHCEFFENNKICKPLICKQLEYM